MDRLKYLDRREVRKLTASARRYAEVAQRDEAIRPIVRWMTVDLALATGLRAAEMVSILWRDLDENAAYIRVHRGKKRRGQPVIEAIAISDSLVQHLVAYRADLRARLRPATDDDHVLQGERGPLTRTALWRQWQYALKLAGLAPRPLHHARHTLAVHLLRGTGNLRLVQKQLGHSNPTVTANLYADVPYEDMRAAANGVYGDE